jgi:DNA-binding NarL/FixJ family response regulator
VKQIVDELNGSIKVSSNPEIDLGTEIIIALKKCHESHLHDVTANTERIYHEFSGNVFNETLQTLLIVEDDVSLLKLMTSKLNEKYNLHIAANGNEALEKLKSIRNLNLIISDVMMDNGNGFELYEQITKQKRFKHVPFIFITAKTEDRRKGLELGAVDYISKPFLVDDLAFKIDALLNNISEQIGAFSNAFHQSIVSRGIETENVTAATQDIVEKSAVKYNLTSRERKIVPLVIKGLTNKEIAEKLFISDKTVKSHLQNIFEKVGVASKLELIHKFGDFN